MQEFEVIGLEDGDKPRPVDSGESSVSRPGSPRWWLFIPAAVVVGLLFVLSRGATDQKVEEAAATTVPASTTTPREAVADTLAASAPTSEELLASFAGQVLLTGASGSEIRVNDLSTGTSFPLDVKGTPLYFVDGWLVYVEEARVQVLNLLDAASLPLVLVENEAAGSGFQVVADASSTFLTITEFSSEGVPSAFVTGFVIGEWSDPTVTDAAGQWFREGGVVSSSGSGTYELTPDGYQRRGDGFVIGTNRDLVVIWECHQSLSSCQMRVRDRATWNVVGSSVKATPNTDIVMAPQGAIVLQVDWRQATSELVNLMTGDRIDLDTSGFQIFYFEKLLGVSDSAALAVTDGLIVVIDRVTGAIATVDVDGAPSSRQAVLVESMLPYLMEHGQ